MNLEIIYLQLKIITLAITLATGVGIGSNILWQFYTSHKDFKKHEAERKKRESNPEFKKEQEKSKRGLGLTNVPKDCYRKEVRCHNCDTFDRYYIIKKGMTEEEFRKITFCDGCDVKLDYDRVKYSPRKNN